MRIVLFIAMFLFAPSALAAAGGATLYVSESCGSYTVGDTFPVSIMVYTGGAPINAAEATPHIAVGPKKDPAINVLRPFEKTRHFISSVSI